MFSWNTLREVSKCGGFSGTYFPVFGLNTEKYGPEKTPYFDTFHAVIFFLRNAIEPGESRHLRFFKKTAPITRCPLDRGYQFWCEKSYK